MLTRLSGANARGVSGLCLIGPGWEELEHEITRVTFRELSAGEIDAYLVTDEWRGRAGAYAVQGLGARHVARIDGDYLNVVGLPAALLVSILARRYPAFTGSASAAEATVERPYRPRPGAGQQGKQLDSATAMGIFSSIGGFGGRDMAVDLGRLIRSYTCGAAASSFPSRRWSRSTSARARCTRSASRPSACSVVLQERSRPSVRSKTA